MSSTDTSQSAFDRTVVPSPELEETVTPPTADLEQTVVPTIAAELAATTPGLQKTLKEIRRGTHDETIAELAVTRKLVTQEMVKLCQQTVREIRKANQQATLVDVMVEKNIINAETAKELISTSAETIAAAPEDRPAGLPDELSGEVGDFVILGKLGEGGMGAVYKALWKEKQTEVALKVLPRHLAKDQQFVDRFYREANSAIKLEHTNIVRGFNACEVDGNHLFAMELVDGFSVQDYLDKKTQLSVKDAVNIIGYVARALAYAHDHNIIHRDIKPDNIMLTKKGHVKLADLGLAKQTDSDQSITQSGTGFGTPYYMPPEQAKSAKHVDGRSDIYALGATMYHLLAGQVPFDGETAMDVLLKHEKEQVPPMRRLNPNVPESLQLIVEKMMMKDPKHRFQTCHEVLGQLERSGFVKKPAPKGAAAGKAAVPGAASPTGSGVRGPTAAVQPAAGKDTWYIQVKRDGKLHKLIGDTNKIRKLIRADALDVAAKASRNSNGPFRALSAIGEFSDLTQSRVQKKRVSRKLQAATMDYEAMERKYRMKKAFKNLLNQAWSAFWLLAFLGGISFVIWKFWPQISQFLKLNQ